MNKSWRVAMTFCAGLLMTSGTFAQDTTPTTDAAEHNHLVTDCMTQQEPAMKKEDALKACRGKLRQGIKVDRKKRKPANTPASDATAA